MSENFVNIPVRLPAGTLEQLTKIAGLAEVPTDQVALVLLATYLATVPEVPADQLTQAHEETESLRARIADDEVRMERLREAIDGRWIPCTERMPEIGARVLLWNRLRGMVVGQATQHAWLWSDRGDCYPDETSWAPLPSPPET